MNTVAVLLDFVPGVGHVSWFNARSRAEKSCLRRMGWLVATIMASSGRNEEEVNLMLREMVARLMYVVRPFPNGAID